MAEKEEQTKIPLHIPIEMIKEALKTLPLEDIMELKRLIDEVIAEYEDKED